MIRFVPTLVGMAAFALLAILYACHLPIYMAVLRWAGILPWSHPFIDGGFMFAMKRCWLQGVDVYKSVPCDIISGNKMAYPPLWQRLPALPSSDAARLPIGITTDLLLLLTVTFLPPARRVFDVVLLSLAIISTMVCFALERNNIDVWMYLLIFAGVQLLQRGGRVTVPLGYGIFLLAGLLKYYPMALFGLALRERPQLFFRIAVLAVAILAVFIVTFRAELAEELANIPTGSPFGDLIGIANIPLALRSAVASGGNAGNLTALVCRLLMTVGAIGLSVDLARRPALQRAFDTMAPGEMTWLVTGCLVMGACYLMGQNVGYRGIYLLLVLSGLLALMRNTTDPAVRPLLACTVILLVAMMWMEAIRLWIHEGLRAVPLTPGAGNAVQGLVWLGRELLWFNLERVMLAILIIYALRSRMRQSLFPSAAF